MDKRLNRRQILQQLASASAAVFCPPKFSSAGLPAKLLEAESEIQIAPVSTHTFRLSILPIENNRPVRIPSNGSLVQESWGLPIATLRGDVQARTMQCGGLRIAITPDPLAFSIANAHGEAIQNISVDRQTGVVTFNTGDAPLLGLGEGGPQFDRRGSADPMISGQGGYHLATHGGRVPIPWLISTSGWAIYFHQPFGTFDFTGPLSRFQPESEPKLRRLGFPEGTNPDAQVNFALPLDLFFVASLDPPTVMAEYARLTGLAEMPPL